MDNNFFIKYYSASGPFIDLPADSYWLLREESVLSYLSQRGMSVPKVYLKNLEEKSITLENVGISFDKLFINSNKQSSIEVFQYVRSAIIELLKIFNSGVLHLDVAARNFCLNRKLNNKIFVLDFSHCISSYYILQKPIPLLPQEQTHHPLLVDALRKDWIDFYTKSEIKVPDLDKQFDVDNNLFANYWTNELAVQKLHNSFAVLSHSIGQFYLEISESPVLTKEDKIFVINLGQSLRFNDENYAESNIHQSLRELENYSPATSKSLQSETQIPNVIFNNPISDKKSNSSNFSKNLLQNIFSKKKINQIISSDIIFSLNSKNVIFFNLFVWFLLIINAFWIDFVIGHTELFLADWIIYFVFFISLYICFVFFLSIFKKTLINKITSDIPFAIFLIELTFTFYLFLNFYSHFITWLPSFTLSIFIFLGYLLKKSSAVK